MKASRRALIVGGTIEGAAVILAVILPDPYWPPVLDRAWWTLHEPAWRVINVIPVVLTKNESFVAVVLVQLILWMVVFGVAFWLVDLCREKHAGDAEPGAAPNGDPAEPSGNSEPDCGSPSVS